MGCWLRCHALCPRRADCRRLLSASSIIALSTAVIAASSLGVGSPEMILSSAASLLV
jgi:hypothetical protein